jgi:isopenicillin N synthase-like dioxygenase
MTLQSRTATLDRSDLSSKSEGFDRIPIIDIGDLWSEQLAHREAVAEAIGHACRKVGFFYVTNHGVPQPLIDAVYRVADEFFQRPMDAKQRYSIERLGRHRGYVAIGQLAADAHDSGAFDFHEGYEISLELPADDPDYLAGNIMYGPNVWPENPPDFQAVVYRYYEAILALGHDLFRAFALVLGLPEIYFEAFIDKPMAQLRVLHYPPQPEPVDPRHIGVGAHTDYECFTILASSAPGLQVQNLAGQWVDAPPVPGAFIINIGDIMARWTNDVFLSTVHRVINRSGARRFSLPFFFGANHNAEVRCLDSCRSDDRPARYSPVTAGEWTVSNISAAYTNRKNSRVI